eukprot:267608-Chlamydomonas_euryale.AAC.1
MVRGHSWSMDTRGHSWVTGFPFSTIRGNPDLNHLVAQCARTLSNARWQVRKPSTPGSYTLHSPTDALHLYTCLQV